MSRSRAAKRRKQRTKSTKSKKKQRAVVRQAPSLRTRLRQQLFAPLYRNALYLIASNVLTGATGLIFWLVAARWFYHTEDVGQASAAISAMQLLSLFATLGLDYAIIRFLPASGKNSNALINTCLTIGGLASIAIALIFIAGLDIWSPALLFIRQHPVFLCAFVIFTACWTLHMLVTRTFVGGRRAVFTLAQGAIFNVLRIILVIGLASFFAVFGIFVSWGIAVAVAVAIGMLWFLPRVQKGYRPWPVVKWKVIKEAMGFSLANYVTALLWFAPGFILPLMVVNMLGAEENAYFYIAWAISRLLFAVPLSISFSLFAEGSYDEKKLGRDTRRSLLLTFSIVIPITLLIILIGDRVLHLFAPDYAENATDLIRILAASALPLSLNYIYFGVKRVEKKMRGIVALNAFIAVATLALSWVLLPRMGITGAGVAWLAGQGAVSLVIVLLWARHIRKLLPGSLYDR